MTRHAHAEPDQAFNPSEVLGSDNFVGREFCMTAADFRKISAMSYAMSGIVLTDAKQEMVYSRLARRVRTLQLKTFEEYLKYIEKHPSGKAEREHFQNAITTNLTSFFREGHHFEYLAKTAIPDLMNIHRHDKRIRVWCCAASTGEEPYSIAMTFREAIPRIDDWDIKILATDIDSECIAQCKAGMYRQDRLDGMAPERVKRWFKNTGSGFEVDAKLKQLLTFKTLNLLDDWPMRGPFDVVFCRNVIIYFDKHTQRQLFARMENLMPSGRYLFIGHSESLLHVSKQFTSQGSTIYHRV
jgi:chemotaxis protein methyltransferase CheR